GLRGGFGPAVREGGLAAGGGAVPVLGDGEVLRPHEERQRGAARVLLGERFGEGEEAGGFGVTGALELGVLQPEERVPAVSVERLAARRSEERRVGKRWRSS